MKTRMFFAIILVVYLVVTYLNKGEFLFKRETGVDLPKGSYLVYSRKDKTEKAYIWQFDSDISKFELPNGLKYEEGSEVWEKLKFDGFGELDSSEYGKNMKFKIIRTSTAHFAVGKDITERKIAFSWINTD